MTPETQDPAAIVAAREGLRLAPIASLQYAARRCPAAGRRDPHRGPAQDVYDLPRDVQAVRGISLNVAAGEFFGLLGPNGAGKPDLGK